MNHTATAGCIHAVTHISFSASLPAKCQTPLRATLRLAQRAPPRCPAIHTRASQATASAPAQTAPAPAISLTDAALAHLHKLRAESGGEALLLRIGVKSGGCSGMSYHMDFEDNSNVSNEDAVIEYDDGFRLVCDPKSLLYLFGMQLDYSNALIGGGFQFQNPNAASSCGCGKSFGV